MKTTIKDLGKGQKEIEIETAWDEIRVDYDDVLNEYAGIPVPGFRPGKTPKGVIEKRFKKEILNAVGTRCAQRLVKSYLDREGMAPAGPVSVTDMEIAREKPLHFKAQLTLMPEFELPDYTHYVSRQQDDSLIRDEIASWLLEHVAMEAPEELIKQELSFAEDGENQMPGSEVWSAATQRVKLLLIFHKIARLEGIEVDDKDIEERIAQTALEMGTSSRQLKKELMESGGLSRISAFLRSEKVLDYLIELARGAGA